MNVHTEIAGPITFRDGTPVVDKILVLEAEVSHLVHGFKPLFD